MPISNDEFWLTGRSEAQGIDIQPGSGINMIQHNYSGGMTHSGVSFLSRYNAQGVVQQKIKFGYAPNSGTTWWTNGMLNQLETGSNGGLYGIGSQFYANSWSDVSPISNGYTGINGPEGTLVKYNANGSNAWHIETWAFGNGSDGAWVDDLIVDNNENTIIYSTGIGHVNVSSTASNSLTQSYYTGSAMVHFYESSKSGVLAKFNSQGELIWAHDINGVSGIEIMNTDHVIIAGNLSQDSIDLDPGSGLSAHTTANSSGDMYVAKWHDTDSLEWLSFFGNGNANNLLDVAVDDSNNTVVVGMFLDQISFAQVTLQSEIGKNFFVAKFDENGNELWIRHLSNSNTSNNSLRELECAGTDIFVAGSGPMLKHHHNGFTDNFYNHTLLQWNSNGDLVLATQLPTSTNSTKFYALSESVYLTGTAMNQTFNFGHLSHSCEAPEDIIFTKINPCIKPVMTGPSDTNQICLGDSILLESFGSNIESYYWSNEVENGSYISPTATNTYYVTGLDSNGCRVQLSTHIEVSEPTYGGEMIQICEGESVVINGQPRNTSGVYYQYDQNTAGCDSVTTVFLSVIQPTVTNASAHLCEGESVFVGGANQTVAGEYYDTLQSSMGCDSIIATQVTTTNIDEVVSLNQNTLTATSNADSYTWIDCEQGEAIYSNSQMFAPTQSGNYRVILTKNQCVDTSTCEFVNILNITHKSDESIAVYPNPATDILNIHTNLPGTMLLLNYLGQRVASQTLVKGANQIALNGLVNGHYTLIIQNTDSTHYKTIAKVSQ
ncbi:MAG: hypothetical protein Salg2KO_20190 [Salibacteraceae bacterium]